MNKVILDEALRSKLNGLNTEMELCDETGKTVGHFLPPEVYRELIYAWAKTQDTDEEIAQAKREVREQGGLTTAEVLAHLESLKSSGRDGA
jgi:hypothetical protein